MTPIDKKNLILDSLDTISDARFQRESWFNDMGSRYVSSPIEEYCSLFDDSAFDEFLDAADNQLTEDQVLAGKQFSKDIDQYYDSLPDEPDAHYVFNDPKWDEIRQKAKHLIKVLSK